VADRRGPTKPGYRREGVKTLNVAGNRESSNPGIGDRVERFLAAVFAWPAPAAERTDDGPGD